MINYSAFLAEVDRLTSAGEADSLRRFIHDLARMVPESDRLKFLELLEEHSTGCEEGIPEEKEEDKAFGERIDALLKALEEIWNGERMLEVRINEEWDDWNDDLADEYLFSDPGHILDDISAAVGALHQCLDRAEYRKGAELAKKLSGLEVFIDGDYYGKDQGLSFLDDYNLVEMDLWETIREAMYLAYMGTPSPDGAEAMAEVMENFHAWSVSLEEILQTGPDEIDLESFLPAWIEALAGRPADKTDGLLDEAMGMMRDGEAALELAGRYAESHPVLYRSILRTGLEGADAEEMMNVGLLALKAVPGMSETGSGIALLTAKYALAAGKRETAEDCWMEAFAASPAVVNYLRLRLESRDWKKYAGRARTAYADFYEARTNDWEKRAMAPLLFFDERFDEMLDRFMDPGKGIGWSSTFMKPGIALMLLLLDNGSADGPGMTKMWGWGIGACSFDGAAYREGTDLLPGTTEAMFRDCFRRWKSRIVLPEDVCESWLGKIDGWLELRVSAIMSANRRNYYGECAAYAAAYGEVLESRGMAGGKQRTLRRFREEYPRRTAFHAELRTFGMRE